MYPKRSLLDIINDAGKADLEDEEVAQEYCEGN